jgi:hypothetical protein
MCWAALKCCAYFGWRLSIIRVSVIRGDRDAPDSVTDAAESKVRIEGGGECGSFETKNYSFNIQHCSAKMSRRPKTTGSTGRVAVAGNVSSKV